jgi:hypothetical protein
MAKHRTRSIEFKGTAHRTDQSRLRRVATGVRKGHRQPQEGHAADEAKWLDRALPPATTDSEHDGPIFSNLAKKIADTWTQGLGRRHHDRDRLRLYWCVGHGELSAIAIGKRIDARCRLPHSGSRSQRADRHRGASNSPAAVRSTLPKITAPSCLFAALHRQGHWALGYKSLVKFKRNTPGRCPTPRRALHICATGQRG